MRSLVAQNLCKSYKKRKVVDNVSLEVNKGENAYILRASEYSIDNKKHTAFELKWMEYLSDNLSEIVRPQKSLRNSLFEVINAGDKA